MNVLTCKWEEKLLRACGGPELRAKLGPEPVIGGTILGTVHPWWVERWGFDPGIASNVVVETLVKPSFRLYCHLIYR